ncbi:MAG: T9SS type A sorting domain-containing protein [Gelidibacter sp.]|nr:T9SS type A sorting domain-containing protein [Gelidibacter sp.]
MKKNYNFKLFITFIFVMFLFLKTTGQVRIVEVDPATERVKLHNYGSTTVDINNYWFCSKLNYGQLSGMTLVSGSRMLAAGADVELTSSVSLDAAADLGFYNTNSFGLSTAMVDFTQWGGSFSFPDGRENVAVNKGIWTVGTFISAPAPYQYSGNGAQNGVAFWNTLGIEDVTVGQFKILQNPSKSKLELSLPRVSGVLTMEIFDVLGKKIFTKELNSMSSSIDVSKWNSGVYLVRLSADNITQTKRFIKQ